MTIFRKPQQMIDDILDPDVPLTHIPKEPPQNERSFGDDISIPNLVREHAPRHIQKLENKRAQMEAEIRKINVELNLLYRLQQALEEV